MKRARQHIFQLKLVRRLLIVFGNTAFTLAGPLSTLILSVIVIRIGGSELWGEIIAFWLIVLAINRLISWGHKEYLLKIFSQSPAKLAQRWQENVFTRFFLLLPICVGACLFLPDLEYGLTLSVLCLGLFFHRSFVPVVIYLKQFNTVLVIEGMGLLLMVAGVMYFRLQLTARLYLQLLAAFYLLKSVGLLLLFFKDLFPRVYAAFSSTQLKQALPYLALTFLGFWGVQVNSYVLMALGNHDQLGTFQVVSTLFMFVRNGASFVLQPFTKNLLRSHKQIFQKLDKQLVLMGLGASVFGGLFIAVFVPLVYAFDLGWEIYVVGILYAMPYYFFALEGIKMVKLNQEKWIIRIGLVNLVINLCICMLLVSKMGLLGALLAACIGEWTLLVMFRYVGKRLASSAQKPHASS